MKRKPQYFLLGAPKCGTTALASYLADHPLVYVSKPKEPHYFCKDLKAGGIPVKSDEEYLATFFPGLDESKALAATDCSVWYLYSQVAVREILHFCPDARFLVMLRNPVNMMWSYYCQMTFQGQEDQKDIFTAWELQKLRIQGSMLPNGLFNDVKMLLYRDVCALGSQLKRVMLRVPRERLHIELQDDLKKDARAVYLNVLSFMEIPDDGRTDFPRENAGRKINNSYMYKILRSPLMMNTIRGLKRLSGIKSFGFGRPDLPMPPDVRSFLTKQFQDEICILEEMLDKDLSHWSCIGEGIDYLKACSHKLKTIFL